MDVMGDVAWNQNQIAAAQACAGKWSVKVCQEGDYRISLRRWPKEFPLAICETCSGEDAGRLAPYEKITPKSISPERAAIKLFERSYELPVNGSEKETVFAINIPRIGETVLEAWFIEGKHKQGAYYVYIERI
jgi:hypothetical protein